MVLSMENKKQTHLNILNILFNIEQMVQDGFEGTEFYRFWGWGSSKSNMGPSWGDYIGAYT